MAGESSVCPTEIISRCERLVVMRLMSAQDLPAAKPPPWPARTRPLPLATELTMLVMDCSEVLPISSIVVGMVPDTERRSSRPMSVEPALFATVVSRSGCPKASMTACSRAVLPRPEPLEYSDTDSAFGGSSKPSV